MADTIWKFDVWWNNKSAEVSEAYCQLGMAHVFLMISLEGLRIGGIALCRFQPCAVCLIKFR